MKKSAAGSGVRPVRGSVSGNGIPAVAQRRLTVASLGVNVSSSEISGGSASAGALTHGRNHGGVAMDVRVIVRKRPVPEGEVDVIDVSAPKLTVLEQKVKVDLTKYMEEHAFTYDDTFSEADDTRELYDRSVQDLVTNVFDGGTSTAFCFGQTASGKTFTLFGAGGGQIMTSSLVQEGSQDEAAKGGVYLLAAYEIYQHVKEIMQNDPDTQMTVALSST